MLFSWGHGESLTLSNTSLATLQAGDFVFASLVETFGSTRLAQTGQLYDIAVMGNSAVALKYAGQQVWVGQMGSWSAIGAEAVTGGYDVAWKNAGADQYSVWLLDAAGNYLSNLAGGILSGGSAALQDLESVFQQDLNGDGTVGPVTTVVEAFGATTLAQVGSNYALYATGTSSGPHLRYAGADVAAGQLGAWTPIGAEATGAGYQVAWRNGTADQYSVWTLDAAGNYSSNAGGGVVSGSSAFLQELESTFHQDLNGDGTVGPVTTTIEALGATTLVQVGSTYLLYASGTTTGPHLRYGGADVVAGQYAPWTAIGAEAVGGGYEVAWKNAGADQYSVWTLDAAGNYVGSASGGVVSGGSATLQDLESVFHQDLNGDGTVGPVTTTIEALGATTLVQVGSTYLLYASGTTTGPHLRYGGADVVAGQYAPWTAIGAEAVGGGYEVAWKNAGADQYSVWMLDAAGNYTGSASGGVVSGSSAVLQGLESSFHQDLNGDGTVGPVTTTIEALGATTLVQAGSTYLLYASGTTTGPHLRYGGADVVAGQYAPWKAIGAEAVGGGYDIAWKNAGADQYSVWTLDAAGNYVGSASGGVVSGSSAVLQGLESSFHQDLNGDGSVGPVTTVIEAFGATTLAQVGGSYVMSPTGTSDGPHLRYGGADVAAGQFGTWSPIAAEAVGGGFQVVWRNAGVDQYSVWNLDAAGNYTSNAGGGVVSGNSSYLKGLEATFHQDLNGDATIGAAVTAVESPSEFHVQVGWLL
ncbi:MAG: hypothetical protein LCH95_10380 [Proteobacteria bacterium]|nr:hypothetical protein [Pseudomonadota bacterium]